MSSDEQQISNNDLAEHLVKTMEGIAALGEGQGQIMELVGKLAGNVGDLVDHVGELQTELQRALDQVQAVSRIGVRKVQRS